MTFTKRGHYSSTIWHEKVLVMDIFHLAMSNKNSKWTLINTAKKFNCSISLVSENLKLAKLIRSSPNILKCKSRKEALRKSK